ncbi:hypothetical protein DFH09DRAFT_1409514 [Mycena vulgaris]|nr:hypothetical protein DFH09DRAFT_1409514 [Mycena vulgaris]
MTDLEACERESQKRMSGYGSIHHRSKQLSISTVKSSLHATSAPLGTTTSHDSAVTATSHRCQTANGKRCPERRTTCGARLRRELPGGDAAIKVHVPTKRTDDNPEKGLISERAKCQDASNFPTLSETAKTGFPHQAFPPIIIGPPRSGTSIIQVLSGRNGTPRKSVKAQDFLQRLRVRGCLDARRRSAVPHDEIGNRDL